MDFNQTKRRRRCPWCGHDACVLGWVTAMPQATVPTTMVSKKTGLNPVQKLQYLFSTYPYVGTIQKIIFTLVTDRTQPKLVLHVPWCHAREFDALTRITFSDLQQLLLALVLYYYLTMTNGVGLA